VVYAQNSSILQGAVHNPIAFWKTHWTLVSRAATVICIIQLSYRLVHIRI